jgi:hypothetical protein
MKDNKYIGIGVGVGIVALVVWGLVALFTPSVCENPPTCKFEKGDKVQNKSSRWAKKGAVVDVWVSGDCDCMYNVSNTTWIEGRRVRQYYEYELEKPGFGIDVDAGTILDKIFD